MLELFCLTYLLAVHTLGDSLTSWHAGLSLASRLDTAYIHAILHLLQLCVLHHVTAVHTAPVTSVTPAHVTAVRTASHCAASAAGDLLPNV